MGSCEGVILAAGLSTRAGRFKMELPLGDKTVVQRAVEGMYDVVDRLIVVVGWKAERIRTLLASYAKVEIVPNDDYRLGMFSSVRAGIARVRGERFFLLPGDYPLIDADTYHRLLLVSGEVVIPSYQGRKGHPVLLDSRLIAEILRLPPEATLRDYLACKGQTIVEVPDRGVLLDVDTPEDYAVLAALSGKWNASDEKEGHP